MAKKKAELFNKKWDGGADGKHAWFGKPAKKGPKPKKVPKPMIVPVSIDYSPLQEAAYQKMKEAAHKYMVEGGAWGIPLFNTISEAERELLEAERAVLRAERELLITLHEETVAVTRMDLSALV